MPQGDFHQVGSSPLSIFFQGTSRCVLEDCVGLLEHAAEQDFTINLRVYPMSKDITGFLIVKTVTGRIVTNGLGSLHRLDSGMTRVICEVPRFSRRDVLLGLIFLIGAMLLALFAELRPLDRLLLVGIALLFPARLIRREYYRQVYAHELLGFIRRALSISPNYPLLPQ
jgi:hypothetical protein